MLLKFEGNRYVNVNNIFIINKFFFENDNINLKKKY